MQKNNYTYKIAGVEDVDQLVATRIEVLRAANKLNADTDMSQVEKTSRHYYEKAIPGGSHTAILVYDGDRVIGAGGISFFRIMPTYHNPTGKKAYIMNMYTHPDYRRQGIAIRTLDMLVSDALEKGIECITLEATEMGRPLYMKYGFVDMHSEMELKLE